MQRVDAHILSVQEAFLGTLDDVEQVKAEDFIGKAQEAAEEQWQGNAVGISSDRRQNLRVDDAYQSQDELGTLAAVEEDATGDGDPAGSSLSPQHLQRELCKLSDCTRLRRLEKTLQDQCNWDQWTRLRELRHPEVSHRWIWHLDSVRGSVLTESDYILNVQKRLGARILEAEVECHICGCPLDSCLEHGEVCATAEATRGHYAVVRALVDGIRIADPGVTTEPWGLTTTQARPADIFTNAAVPGRCAALDVCVASPIAAAAGDDAAEAAFKRKLRHYAGVLPQLRQAGIAFRPLIWTADGRPHPAATRTLRFAAERAARRDVNGRPAKEMMGRWKHEVAIAIARRRAGMARAVMPRKTARQRWLLNGMADQAPTSNLRQPCIEDDATLADEASLNEEAM